MRSRDACLKRRKGFTLLETLTVMIVLAILTSLALPAVLNARMAARKMSCRNNLAQIGLALYTYHDSYNTFPPPWTLDWSFDDYSAPSDNLNAHSWGQMLLPFLGETDLFESIDMSHPAFDGSTISNLNMELGTTFDPAIGDANVSTISQTLRVFNCPSTPGGPRVDPFSIPGEIPELGFSFDLNYVISSSDYYTANGVQCEFYYGCGLGGVPGYYNGPTQVLRDGIMAQVNEANSMRTVVDGLSQTFLIVERAGANDVYRGRSKIHDGSDGPFEDPINNQYQAGGGWGDIFNGEFWPAGSLEDGTSPTGNGPCLINCNNVDSRNLYSFHPGGVNVLMADGATRFISETINTDIVCQLFSRAGGSSVGGF